MLFKLNNIVIISTFIIICTPIFQLSSILTDPEEIHQEELRIQAESDAKNHKKPNVEKKIYDSQQVENKINEEKLDQQSYENKLNDQKLDQQGYENKLNDQKLNQQRIENSLRNRQIDDARYQRKLDDDRRNRNRR